MRKNSFTPKVNGFPLANVNKMPLGQAIQTVGKASGLKPAQAAVSAALTQSGRNPGAVIIGNPKDPNRGV